MKTRHQDTLDENRQPYKSASVTRKAAVLSQAAHIHRRLSIATILILMLATVIVIHQGILLTGSEGGVHTLAHVLMMAMAIAIIISNIIVWMSYKTLHRYQGNVLTNHGALEKSVLDGTMALDKSESLLVSVFNAFEERTLVVDANFKIIRANRAAIEWVGDDPAGYLFADIFPDCDPANERRSELRLIKDTFATAKTHRNRLIRGGKDCASVLSVDTYPVLSRRGRVFLVIGVARDVTRETENEMLARHREKMASLGLLAAGFSHELGNPLASLSTELELLERNPDKSRLLESVAMLKKHLGRISRTFNKIRGFAQKRSAGSREAIIKDVISDSLHMVAFDPRAKKIKIHTDVPDSLCPVTMNEDELNLVLINLIVNAFDAMPDGGVLTITAKPEQSGGSSLLVNDTGTGMEHDVLLRATFPLFTTKHDTSGMGIGLALCAELLQAAGAQLNISSTPGKGTTVAVHFPGMEHKD